MAGEIITMAAVNNLYKMMGIALPLLLKYLHDRNHWEPKPEHQR